MYNKAVMVIVLFGILIEDKLQIIQKNTHTNTQTHMRVLWNNNNKKLDSKKENR